MKINVIGLGYIGLPTAALLANKGYKVHGVDIVPRIVETINKGKIHIVEPDLDSIVKAAVNKGNLKADTKPTKADVFIIAVPTPFYKSGYNTPTPNIEYVIDATKSIAPYVSDGNLIILESTSPVGTTKKVEEVLRNEGVDTSKIYIAHCPERVLPGQIIQELVKNDRIVGGLTKEATKKVADFYRSFVTGKVLETDAKTAELCKLVENSYRDVNIAFANELSIICDMYGIDVWELRELANKHPRVNILLPGVGVGGHCIAVDPWFIVADAKDKAKLIKTARAINTYKTEWVIKKIKSEIVNFQRKQNKDPKIALMGLTYKPDIDDLRESPALYIARQLKEDYNNLLLIVEPNLTTYDEFNLVDYINAINKADIIIFLVAHKQFKNKNLNFKNKKILDFCGVTKL